MIFLTSDRTRMRRTQHKRGLHKRFAIPRAQGIRMRTQIQRQALIGTLH